MKNKITGNLALIILLGIFFVINIFSIRHLSITTDEPCHLSYGKQILQLNSERYIDGVMPISALNVLPLKMGDILSSLINSKKYLSFFYSLNSARLITILFAVLLGFYVFKWTKELYGNTAAIFSLLLFTFSPNIIAHSQLVTGDLYATLMITISTYYFWLFLNKGGWKRAVICAITLGIAQISKGTCLFLYPIFLLITLIKYYKTIKVYIKTKDKKSLLSMSNIFIKYSVLFILISIIIINIGFLFNNTLMPLREYNFRYPTFQKMKSIFPYLPAPFPKPFVDNLDWVKYNERTGDMCGNIYLLGKLQGQTPYLTGFKNYYFIAYLFKEPITIQIFLIITIILYIKKRKEYNFYNNESFLVFSILFFTLYFNFFFRRQLGIRNIIIIFPFIYIWIGSIFKNWQSFKKKIKGVTIILIIYLIVSVLSYFPQYIPYFNEFVWDRKQAYKILADSNLDWGQGKWYEEQYLKKYPNSIIDPNNPVSGRIIVGASNLVGVIRPHYRFQWLRVNFKPIYHIAYSYLVFDVPEESVDTLKKMYPVPNLPTGNRALKKHLN